MSYNDSNDTSSEFTSQDGLHDDVDEIDLAPNEAKVIVTLIREEDGVSGVIDTIEGFDFDPGDTEEFVGRDLLRAAAEMVLMAAGYDDQEVQSFLDTASRAPVEMDEAEEES